MSAQLPDVLSLVQVVALALARALGMALFLPFLNRQQMSGLVRMAVCLGLSVPAAVGLWPEFVRAAPSPAATFALGFKEALLGALLGMLVALPFWAIRGMGTLIDNQRGANAAQQVNPALQADATLLGELSERALLTLVIDAGLLQACFAVLVDSYAHWRVLDLLPVMDAGFREGLIGALAGHVTQALVLAAPALLLLLLIELALAITSTAVQGFDVYASSMAVKSIVTLVILAVIAPTLFDHATREAGAWWQDGLRALVGLPR